MIALFDTSALLKLVVDEDESSALENYVATLEPTDVPIISALAVTELRRACLRLGISPLEAVTLTAGYETIRLSQAILELAGRYPYRHLGTLDAIHLATAATVAADSVVTYDRRLAQAARDEGLTARSPGQDT